MKRGFTLLELVAVIIIIGILATLALGQYQLVIEKSRGSEAKQVLGMLRSLGAAYYLEYNDIGGFDNTDAGIGTEDNQIPSACRTSHYFRYAVSTPAGPTMTATATRCISGGKPPDAAIAKTLILTSNFSTGVDDWTGTGNY